MRWLFVFLLCSAAVSCAHGAATAKGNELTIQKGREVTMEYTVAVDGKVIDGSKKGELFRFIEGKKEVIPGLEKQLEGMRVGEKRTITIPPKEGYGMVNPALIKEFARSILPAQIPAKPDTYIYVKLSGNRLTPARIVEVKKDTVMLDFNHPLAGKTLVYKVKIVSIK